MNLKQLFSRTLSFKPVASSLIIGLATISLTACSCGTKKVAPIGSEVAPVTMGESAGSILENELRSTKVGDRVYFKTNSSTLSDESKQTLDRQAALIKANPKARFVIEGYCDERGTEEYNLALGERRANSAKHYLVHQGISGDTIGTVSFGKERPAMLGHNEEAWKFNRRAVTVVADPVQ